MTRKFEWLDCLIPIAATLALVGSDPTDYRAYILSFLIWFGYLAAYKNKV